MEKSGKYGRGDNGKTYLPNGKRVWKNDVRIEALGEIDELSSTIGITISLLGENDEVAKILLKVQEHLFILGSYLSLSKPLEEVYQKIEEALRYIDQMVYEYESKLPPLTRFIFLGGSPPAAMLYFARAVARRVERRIVSMSRKYRVHPSTIAYLNRCSTLFFILARYLNMMRGYREKEWLGMRQENSEPDRHNSHRPSPEH